MSDYPSLPLPNFLRVRQALPNDRVPDVAAAVRTELERIGLAERLTPGWSVAITAGSRGIADIALVIKTVAEVVRAAGAQPFVVPAMGSHGGATAEGQRHVLAEYGITERSVGAPIRAAMDTVELGRLPSGARVYCAAVAGAANGTSSVGRVKANTAFRGEIESGLCKMTAIGLGKQRGAEQIHAFGLREHIPLAASLALQHSNVVAGLALVENAAHELAQIRATLPARFQDTDRELLRTANEYLPRIPFDHLHVLVVGWLGKNISGSGMDYNVVGMWRRIGGEMVPNFERIVVLDLTEQSDGNGLGVGIADFTTRRLYDKLDLPKMYMNGLTGNALAAIKIPIVLETDRQAMEVALHSVGHATDARVAIVRSTADLDELWVSEALGAEVAANPALSILSADAGPSAPARMLSTADPALNPSLNILSTARPLEFGSDGRLAVVRASARSAAHVP